MYFVAFLSLCFLLCVQEEIRQDLSTTYDPTASPLHRRDPMAVSDDSFSHRRESIATMDTSPLRRNGPIGVVDISSSHRRDSSTAIDPCNLDQTHLEGRVNGPTQEMSQGWISLGSHSHFLHGSIINTITMEIDIMLWDETLYARESV